MGALLSFLDESGFRYWATAWSLSIGVVVAAVLLAFPTKRRAWWQHPAWFLGLSLCAILAFRWPVLLDNTQLADPDESQLLSGAITIHHDARYWLSVDGTTHGPLAPLPLVSFLLAGKKLDYAGARAVSVVFAWMTLLAAWLIFRHLFGLRFAGLLALPLIAASAFPHETSFIQYYSEHPAVAALAVGCALIIISSDSSGLSSRRRLLYLGGAILGLIPFIKLQAGPIAAWIVVWGAVGIVRDSRVAWPDRWRLVGKYTASLSAMPLTILALIAIGGIWPDFWHSYIVNNLHYAGDRPFTWIEMPAKLFELGSMAEGFNYYLGGMVAVGMFSLLLVFKIDGLHRAHLLFFGGFVLISGYATLAPGRPFMHYLNFMIFPIGVWGALGAGTVLALVQRRWPTSVGAAVLVVLVFLGCGLVPQTVWRATHSYLFLYQGKFKQSRAALTQSGTAREILSYAQPRDAIAIWGWRPALWVETQLVQGTRDGNTYRQIVAAPDRDYYRARYLSDIRRIEPAFFVDAVGPGNFIFQNREVDAVESYPELNAYITDFYRQVTDLDGCRFFVRKGREKWSSTP